MAYLKLAITYGAPVAPFGALALLNKYQKDQKLQVLGEADKKLGAIFKMDITPLRIFCLNYFSN